MKSNLLCLLFLVVFSFGATAQSTKTSEKVYTYEEAVELLKSFTESNSDFQAKGISNEIPSMGQQIRNSRLEHDISLSTLAFIAGLSEESMEKIEDDLITPTRDIIAKIEDFLGEEIVLMNY